MGNCKLFCTEILTTKSDARYTDIRDDRVNFYFDLNQQSKPETKKPLHNTV
jgi:hypothetical protein